jgi:N utilization substance protein A
VNAIQELAKEKGIDPEVLFKAVEDALVVAYKKNFDSTQTVRVELDKNKGDFHVFEQRTVVEDTYQSS